MKGFFEQGTVFHDPALECCVVHGHAAFLHQLFDMPVTQRIRHIPPDTHENDLFGEMGSFEAYRQDCSPSLRTVAHRERAYLKSCRSKIRDKTSSRALSQILLRRS
jgi:hypothetical protein